MVKRGLKDGYRSFTVVDANKQRMFNKVYRR